MPNRTINTDSEQTTVNELLCNGRVPTIRGTPDNETILGTRGPDVIHGLGGNDTISGLNGNDVICGGEGNDTLSGNNGIDRLFGENGTDTLNGNKGNDALNGGTDTSTDTCNGGRGSDTGTACESLTAVYRGYRTQPALARGGAEGWTGTAWGRARPAYDPAISGPPRPVEAAGAQRPRRD